MSEDKGVPVEVCAYGKENAMKDFSFKLAGLEFDAEVVSDPCGPDAYRVSIYRAGSLAMTYYAPDMTGVHAMAKDLLSTRKA